MNKRKQKTTKRKKQGVIKMPKLKFYDVKAKRSFTTDKYTKVTKNNKKGRKIVMAKAKSPHSSITAWRIVSNTKM